MLAIDYYQSLTSELDAIKNRIRHLVTHWQADGEWKEAVLRTILRRHLPASVHVGRGFVVSRDQNSTQIDLLVLKHEKPTLFRDGELAIVTPDAPGAIVEVKTNLNGEVEWYNACKKLADDGRMCEQVAKNKPWLGLFTYEGNETQSKNILDAVCRAYREIGTAINCVTCGSNTLVRYWPVGESEPGDNAEDIDRKYWRAYHLERLSPSYFLSNLIDAICNVDRTETDYAWFAYAGGKREHLVDERGCDDCEPDK